MRLDRALRRAEGGGHSLVQPSFGEQRRHFPFPIAQQGQLPRARLLQRHLVRHGGATLLASEARAVARSGELSATGQGGGKFRSIAVVVSLRLAAERPGTVIVGGSDMSFQSEPNPVHCSANQPIAWFRNAPLDAMLPRS